MAKTVDDKKIIYTMDRVSRTHGTKQVLKDISLSYFYGAKIGVIGSNGSGKSSLLRIMAGIDGDYTGEVSSAPGYTIGYLEQEPQLQSGKTVREVVSEGVQELVDLLAEFDKINEAFGDPDADMDKLMEKQAKVQEKLDATDAWNLDSRLDLAMEALRCPPADQVIDVLSGGEKRRVALCRLLLQKPDILLLDEPTNHLDAETVAWLERHLHQYAGTIICVTHDRYFLDNVAGWILELDRGEGIPWKGNYSSWLDQKQKRLALEEKGETERQKALKRELEWIGMSPKGRHAKSKARINEYEKLLAQGSKEKIKDSQITIPPGPRLGNLVIDVKNAAKHYGDRILFDKLNFSVPAGAIVGIIGPNGAGKTTLFKMIVGAAGFETPEGADQKRQIVKPDEGEIKIGDSVKLCYVDQTREKLDPNKTVWEQLSDGLDIIKLGASDGFSGVREVNSRAYCSWFNFSGQDQSRKVGVLSGGERNRLNLAMMLKEGGNVLMLDEPTNDLDVTTLRALEEALESFAGSVLVISHDRWFLDRVCSHILTFEADGEVVWFDGNWTEYAEWRREKYGKDADTPHRGVYRKLER
ncbi:energy-dependent translational throttle protein EttA [Treponema denticola]|jgi:ATP-binding cassette protein, chvD family|uniref:Energy-dependent translational throttle protein EttA n=1 Tax=Treponema denticola H1-T TaxID=999431 RepID=M2C8E2_TREDN|nr:energy-dependent translational throttle protein EttA [Treponema denticola]EMB29878.1 ChvD family ATP-binding cassette protein [Treponema denticola H1-T]EMB30405.1 ChvD family ATP-binding cassette protein [Treponema denticola MYR-T]UTC84921.1 energy-dependent translational throttle protein EttA [Treponema denticola]